MDYKWQDDDSDNVEPFQLPQEEKHLYPQGFVDTSEKIVFENEIKIFSQQKRTKNRGKINRI